MADAVSPLEKKDAFSAALASWFEKMRRPLPWRRDYAPYHVWISEIMLQQTQMDRGVACYLRWMEKFPDIAALADASEEDVLKAWEGLGYYSRARSIVKAAAVLKERFACRFPSDPADIRALPGIGPYTAAAIASIAFNADTACVDANVERIITRLFDIASPVSGKDAKARIADLAAALLPKGQARVHNQAMMELGALVCGKKPDCISCPVSRFCLARERGTAPERPVKKAPPAVVNLVMTAGLVLAGGRCLVLKRPQKGTWGGLWEFPGGEVPEGQSPEKACLAAVARKTGLHCVSCGALPAVRHSFTNHRVTLLSFLLRPENGTDVTPEAGTEWQWADMAGLEALALPSAMRRLAEENRLLLAASLLKTAGKA